MNADPKATLELKQWVARGGVLRVSSDVATLFGFSVVKPRERTFALAGQRFGRAREALPFGASPLLWTMELHGSRSQSDGFPGVREVFYHLPSKDDVLLSDVGPEGVPLLRVEDCETPTYAAAMRHYGRGWVVFTPRSIEPRADGAAFERNIEEFLTASAQGDWLFLRLSALDENRDWASRLTLLPLDDVQEEEPLERGKDRGVALSKGEADAIREVWERADRLPRNEAAQESARAIVALLRVREEEQHPRTSEAKNPAKGASPSVPTNTLEWRDAFWECERDTAYAPFASWWNGVFALRESQVTTGKTEKMGVRPMESMLAAADEACGWWDGWVGRKITLADGTESDSDSRDALDAAQDVDDALVALSMTTGGGKGTRIATATGAGAVTTSITQIRTPLLRRMPFLIQWTPRGGAPCSMEIPATLADLSNLSPDPFFYGMPILHTNPRNLWEANFSWFAPLSAPPGSLTDWSQFSNSHAPDKNSTEASNKQILWIAGLAELDRIGAMPFGIVPDPLMTLPSASIRAQIIWRCGFLWSGAFPARYGFSPLALNFNVPIGSGRSIRHEIQHQAPPPQPPAKKGEPPATASVPNPTETEFHAARWHFTVKPNRTLQAHINGEQIVVPSPWEGPHPSLNTMRWLRIANSWRNDTLTLHRQYIALAWSLDESEATYTPARLARLSATLCLQRWLDDSPQNAPAWMEEGLQNLFSLDTGDYIAQNQATPDNVLMPPPREFLPEIAQITNRPQEFAAMETAARRQSMLCEDAHSPVKWWEGMQPRNGMHLEDMDSTKIMRYFYSQFGAGTVVETLQRLGAGETVDQALQHTIGMNEAELWKEALGK